MLVTCPSFSDEDGKIVYEVEKRYSEFKNTYLAVKDFIPADYKFPNKSIFNNSAQFTKERRLRGFEELLHHMQRAENVREELHSFLELDYNIAKNRTKQINLHQSRTASAVSTASVQSETDLSVASTVASSSHNEPLPSHVNALAAKKDQLSTSSGLPDEMRVRKSLQAVSQYLISKENESEAHLKHASPASHRSSGVSVDDMIRQNPKVYLFFAAKVSALTYVIVVLLGVVDISNAASSQIILTLLALFLLVLLLRIRYERHVATKANQTTTAAPGDVRRASAAAAHKKNM